ncbi:MAG TPA: hypothetical protein VK991_01180 [Halomonas sp.]|nr:hypothetical protein [Halomonas sp.]
MLKQLKDWGFEMIALHHAEAIITKDMPQSAEELEYTMAAGFASAPVLRTPTGSIHRPLAA